MLHRSAGKCGRKAQKARKWPKKRRPPCRHGGPESREETPKEGICGRSCRTATISSLTPALARVFFARYALARRIRTHVAHLPQSDRLLWMSIILIKTTAYND